MFLRNVYDVRTQKINIVIFTAVRTSDFFLCVSISTKSSARNLLHETGFIHLVSSVCDPPAMTKSLCAWFDTLRICLHGILISQPFLMLFSVHVSCFCGRAPGRQGARTYSNTPRLSWLGLTYMRHTAFPETFIVSHLVREYPER